MRKLLFLSLLALVVSGAFGQNSLNNLFTSGTPPTAQVAFSLRQLSTSYTGPMIKVRRSTDNAEGNVAFDASLSPQALSDNSIVTLTPAVTVNASLGTSRTGTVSTTTAKTGTVTVVVNKTGTMTSTLSSTAITGTGTSFTTELAVGDVLYRSSDNALIGIVKSIASNTSLTLQNCTIIGFSGVAFKTQKATVTGSGTLFSTEMTVGDRIYNTSNTYLGTVASITSNTSMVLSARDAVAVSAVAFRGTSATVTGSSTLFTTQLSVGDMLISNNVTLGIVASIESATSLTLTTKAGMAVSALAFKSTASTMSFSSFYSGASTNVFVATWYDQSGFGRDVTQVVAASQPRIVAAGVLKTINSRPSVEFPSTLSTYLQTSSAVNWLSGLYSQNIVSAEVTPITTYQFALSTTGGGGPNNTIMHFGYRTAGQYTVAQYGNDQNFEVFATSNLELHTSVKNTITSSQLYHNGTSLGTLPYQCILHDDNGMRGTLTIVAPPT